MRTHTRTHFTDVRCHFTAVPRSEDNEDARPSEHSEVIPSNRDREDTVPGDGVRQRRRGLRLPGAAREDEGEGGESEVQADRVCCAILPSKEDNSQGLKSREPVAR